MWSWPYVINTALLLTFNIKNLDDHRWLRNSKNSLMGSHHHDFAQRHFHLPPSTVIFTEAACAIYMGVVCVTMKAYVSRVNTSKCRKVVTGDCFGMFGQLQLPLRQHECQSIHKYRPLYYPHIKIYSNSTSLLETSTKLLHFVVKYSFMMTSSNGNIFRVTGHLCGEFTDHQWIPHTKASDAEIWCFLWSASE